MPTEDVHQILLNRTLRTAATTALALVLAYALDLPLPYLAPLLGLIFSLQPGPPPGLRGSLMLLAIITLTTSLGLVLGPLLHAWPVTVLAIIFAGLMASAWLSNLKGRMLPGLLSAIGMTLVTVAAYNSQALGQSLVTGLVVGALFGLAALHVANLLFPVHAIPPAENAGADEPAPVLPTALPLRSALTVFPVLLLALVNPGLFMGGLIKATNLSWQGSLRPTLEAGHSLLQATLLGGLLSILLWTALKLMPNLWMFGLSMLLLVLAGASRLYGLVHSRYDALFWQDVLVTTLILLGPAVQDSSQGKDVTEAFIIRLTLFLLIVVYAGLMARLYDRLLDRRPTTTEPAVT